MKITLYFLLIVITTGSCRQSNPSIPDNESEKGTAASDKELVDFTGKSILTSMEKHDRPSVAVGLIRDGKIMYAKG